MTSLPQRADPSNFALYMPLKFVLGYLAVTLALAVWGPIQYYMFPVGKTAVFMLAIAISITLGYRHGINTGVVPVASRQLSGDDLFVQRLFNFSLSISLASLAVSIVSAGVSGQINTDVSGIGSAYIDTYEGYERNSGSYSLSFIIYSLSLPFNFIAFVLGFYYYDRIGPVRRALVALLVVSSLMFYVVGSGKQKQIGDILIYLIAVFMVRYAVRRRSMPATWVAGAVVLGVGALVVFVSVLGQRYGALGIDVGNINLRVTDRIIFNTSHPVFDAFGPNTGLNLAIFSSYLSQGYYGLGLALETDWQWTHFMGFSYSVSVLANRLIGLDWEWPHTLLSQVGRTTGWGESKWHTVFTHFATDFTFPGTVVLFGYFSYVFSRAWVRATRHENPFAILAFSLLMMGAFFMPANNQLLHSPGGLFTVIVVSFLYIRLGPRYNYAVAR